MSKSILFIISSFLLIEIIYCDTCYSKQLFNYNLSRYESGGNIDGFTQGYLRNVWHHADSCNTYQVEDESGSNRPISCCYIHVEYRSLIDGERYDQYGCIDVLNPWEDYDGSQQNVTNRADDIREKLKKVTVDEYDDTLVVDPDKNLHVKILCSANFLKLSSLSLLVLILF